MNNIQNNYVTLLLMEHLALNAKVSNIIKVMLFFATFREKLNLFRNLENNRLKPLVLQIKSILKQIDINIIKIKEKFANN